MSSRDHTTALVEDNDDEGFSLIVHELKHEIRELRTLLEARED